MRARRTRGAAMVEVCLLCPVMILMWVGINYFRNGYSRRLTTLAQSQTPAWKTSMTNDGSCYKTKEAWAGNQGQDDPTQGGTKGSQAAGIFAGQTKSSLFSYSHTTGEASMKTVAAKFDNQQVGNLSSKTYVLCNEVVPNANADQNVYSALTSFIDGLF